MVTYDDSWQALVSREEVSGRLDDRALGDPGTAAYWQLSYEAQRVRAEAAEVHCEVLRREAVTARSQAGSYQGQLSASRVKLKVARETLAAVRREAKTGLAQQAEVARLRRLLDQAGVDARKRATVVSLRKEVHQLRLRVEALEAEVVALQAKRDDDRSTRAGLTKALYGQRSEQQSRPPSARKPGQQRGEPGHGRTGRPDLNQTVERLDPPPAERTCGICGQPYVANGGRSSTLIEVEIKVQLRETVRSRWRAGCDCVAGVRHAMVPAVGRLFAGTAFGVSFWTWFLMERFVFSQPYRRIGARLADSGLALSAGTLADRTAPFVPLFASLAEAIVQRQNPAVLRPADETRWPVRGWTERGKSGRGWRWISLSEETVCYCVDPSRSTEVAHRLFAGLGEAPATVYLVCDRTIVYKRLAREFEGRMVLCYCWAHCRRDFIHAAAGQPVLTHGCETWIERIGALYRLNRTRLEHIDWDAPDQSVAYQAAHRALRASLDALFDEATRSLAGLPQDARQAQPLRSLLAHREGLCVFADQPRVPMDNNASERALREWVIGRKLSFGSHAVQGAQLKAIMHTVPGTVRRNGLNVRAWLMDGLTACAEHGGQPPADLTPWLPWTMSPSRQRRLKAPP